MRNLDKNASPADLNDSEMDCAAGGVTLHNVFITNVHSPRDAASGQATGKAKSFVADSFSFGVERE